MTIEQITAVNNAMSMLTEVHNLLSSGTFNSTKEWREYVERHVKSLKDAGVDRYITEHFETIALNYTPQIEKTQRHKF